MRRLHFLYVLFISALLSASCKKDNGGGGGDADSPMAITITTPTNNMIAINGTVLRVEGTIGDNNIIQSAKVEIKNKTSGAVLYSNSTPTPNVSFYRFLWDWTVTGASTTSITATVKVTGKDSRGNDTSKEVDVNLVP